MRKWSALIIAVSATAALLVGASPDRAETPERALELAGFGR